MKGLTRFLGAVIALLIFLPAVEAMEVRQYEAISRDQGNVTVNMGRHDYCALSMVAAGGFNSACIVRKQGADWFLVAVDPGKPDAYLGESQACQATCFSLGAAPAHGGLPAPPAAPAGAARYVGCYKDTQTRDINGFTTSNPGMTTQMCVNLCREKGFSYAATQFSTHCFCGDTYGKYGQATNCNMKCGGSSETCGGSWANSVYSIK